MHGQTTLKLIDKFTICEIEFNTAIATNIAVFWDVVQSGRSVLTLQRSQLPPSTGEPNGSIHKSYLR
jgi:hypothetical protein